MPTSALGGPTLRANLDPAHLFYQGMDSLEVARALGRHLGHVHAKVTAIKRREGCAGRCAGHVAA